MQKYSLGIGHSYCDRHDGRLSLVLVVVAVDVLVLLLSDELALPEPLMLADTCAADIAPAASWAVYCPSAFAAASAIWACWTTFLDLPRRGLHPAPLTHRPARPSL